MINNILKKFGLVLSKHRDLNYIAEINSEEESLIKLCLKYSMTTRIRMWSLLSSINYISRHGIQGDFVECGVWKGGNLILFSKLIDKLKLKKNIFGFDTFTGMPKPGKFDFKYSTGQHASKYYNIKKKSNWNEISLGEVKNNLIYENSISSIKLIKGKVENTLRDINNLPKKISILRLDTDFYSSSKVELEVLYPKLVKNGILFLDDYGSMSGQRKAVDEYFKVRPFMFHVDKSSRIIIKK